MLLYRCRILLLTALLIGPGCTLDPADRCECSRPELESLTTADYEAMLEAAVDAGYVAEGTPEYRAIAKAIRKGRFESTYFGDDYRDLGMASDALWTEPAAVSEGCPFEIHWRICFEANECRVPMPAETGEYTNYVSVQQNPADGYYTSGEMIETYTRESMTAGECVEYVYDHSGIETAGEWVISVVVHDPELWECEGKSGRDVEENNMRALQITVGCYCGNQEFYDVILSGGPTYTPGDGVQWIVDLAWEQCLDYGPEAKLFEERVQIERVRDGAVVTDVTRNFTLAMGTITERTLSTSDLEENEEYLVTVDISGDECSCIDTDLAANNSGSSTFSK